MKGISYSQNESTPDLAFLLRDSHPKYGMLAKLDATTYDLNTLTFCRIPFLQTGQAAARLGRVRS